MTSSRKSLIRFLPIATAAAVLAAALIALRLRMPPRPDKFVSSAPGIMSAREVDGVWYWIEKHDANHAILVRADAGGNKSTLASAEQISEFYADGGFLAVISKTGKSWNLTLSDLAGANSRVIWTGDLQPHGALIADSVLYWTRTDLPLIPEGEAFPPLGPHFELMASPIAGGETRTLATIMEPEGRSIIGIYNSQIWVSAYRGGYHDASLLYRVPLAGGVATRVAGQAGQISAVLTSNGDLYWTAPSAEAQNVDSIWCIRKLSPNGKVETLSDWLPAYGALFITRRGILYVDGEASSMAWPVGPHNKLAQPMPLANEFFVVAAGDSDLLLRSNLDSGNVSPLYREQPK